MSVTAASRTIGFILNELKLYGSRESCTVLDGQSIVCGQVCKTDSASKKIALTYTGDETHRYDPNAAPTAGTFRFTLWHKDGYWVTTGDIAYDATNTAIAAACNAVLGTSAVACTGTAATQMDLAFSGTGYTHLSQPLGSMDYSNLTGVSSVTISRYVSAGAANNEVQTVTLSAAMTAGTYGLVIYTPTGIPLEVKVAWDTNWATTMAAINTAITAAATAWYGGASAGAVMTGTATAQILTFSGNGFTGLAIPELSIVLTQDTTGPTSASIARTTAGGLAGNAVGNKADSIALEDCAPSGADGTAVFLVRDGIVDADQLVYGGGDPAASVAALADVRITARNEATVRSIAT